MAPGEKYKAPATIKPYSESTEPTHGDSLLWDATENDFLPGTPNVINANRQTGTAYTLALTDAGKVVEMNNAAANVVTVPANATVAFPVGSTLEILQYGAGATTIEAADGVTIRSVDDLVAISAQYGNVVLRKIATNEWHLAGSLA